MNKPNEPGPNGHCSCDKSCKKFALWIAALPFTALSSFLWEHVQTPYHLIGLRIGQVHLSHRLTSGHSAAAFTWKSLRGDWETGETDKTGERVKQVRDRVCVCEKEREKQKKERKTITSVWARKHSTQLIATRTHTCTLTLPCYKERLNQNRHRKGEWMLQSKGSGRGRDSERCSITCQPG